MFDYKGVFTALETAFFAEAETVLPKSEIQRRLDHYRNLAGKRFTDDEYYRQLVEIVFYSGFKAATVTAKLPTIHKHFPTYKKVALYKNADIKRVLADKTMIRNANKVNACVENARTIQKLVNEHGSVQGYVDSFGSLDSLENLLLLKEDISHRFAGLGEITAYHLLTEMGASVLKPDRVICRIFKRLGLIETDNQLLKTVLQGRKFAAATGHPIRYIDIVFVAYGQMRSIELGIKRGICLEESPACNKCGVRQYCQYNKP